MHPAARSGDSGPKPAKQWAMQKNYPRRPATSWTLSVLACAGLALGAAPLAAQSLTIGRLVTTVVDERGAPVPDVTVTVERQGVAFRVLTTDHAGQIVVTGVAPGQYAVLAEQLGYQPVRARGIAVVAGGTSQVTVRLRHHPPPITSVEEETASAVISGGADASRAIVGSGLSSLAYRRGVTDLVRDFSRIGPAGDGRDGVAGPGAGLPPGLARLEVDGFPEALLRHPGAPAEPVTAPLFDRQDMQQLVVTDFARDVEWRGTLGTLLSAVTATPPSRTTFTPWATASSARLGGRSADNPGDSAAYSVQAGFFAGGPIKGDTAGWTLSATYQQLADPTADPFTATSSAGEPADLGAIRADALANGRTDVTRWTVPTVRRWKGGSGMGRIDWQLGPTASLAFRAGGAAWKEDNPQYGTGLSNGAGSALDASDFSGAATLSVNGETVLSETRLGGYASKRNWSGAGLPYTALVADGVALGTDATLPGNFKESAFDLGETVTYQGGAHELKGGGSFTLRHVTDDWVPESTGSYLFGNVSGFGADQGAFAQAIASRPAQSLSISDAVLFGQDTWQASARLQLFGGVRYLVEHLPSGAVAVDAPWELVAGIANNTVPKQSKGVLGPRVGFVWDADGSGRTLVRATTGLEDGGYDVAALAEAARDDGDVTVRRLTGDLTWPMVGSASTAPVTGTRLTLFGPDVRMPRTYKTSVSIEHALGAGTRLVVSGLYAHTNYLLRRVDVNRIQAPLATAADGRSVWGSLQQYGALIVPAVGSNRRFSEFDMVYGLSSTGYDDDYEATVSLDRQLARGLSVDVSYTWSRTRDNRPGAYAPNPADRLSPFPDGLNGASWDIGTSDLDIPHRAVATVQYASGGAMPLTLAARYRYRSGLPFTPGFPQGVDVNGDGSGGNDPAFIGRGHLRHAGAGERQRLPGAGDQPDRVTQQLPRPVGAVTRRGSVTRHRPTPGGNHRRLQSRGHRHRRVRSRRRRGRSERHHHRQPGRQAGAAAGGQPPLRTAVGAARRTAAGPARPAGDTMMRRLLLLSAALAGAACSNAGENLGLPALRQGTIATRVYLDRDGSQSFTTGDTTFAGIRVALFSAGGRDTLAVVPTDTSGIAIFDTLAVGTYRVASIRTRWAIPSAWWRAIPVPSGSSPTPAVRRDSSGSAFRKSPSSRNGSCRRASGCSSAASCRRRWRRSTIPARSSSTPPASCGSPTRAPGWRAAGTTSATRCSSWAPPIRHRTKRCSTTAWSAPSASVPCR